MDDMQIEPRAVKQRLDRGDKFLLVDVREPWEHEICRIEGAKLIPWARWRGAWRRWSKMKRSCSIAITESAASMQRHGCVPRASRARGRFPAGSSAGRRRLIHAWRAIEGAGMGATCRGRACRAPTTSNSV